MRPGNPGELRISDADRDQISGVLSQHAAEGRLSIDELDQRLGALYSARTRGQAAKVVADLPALTTAGPAPHFHLGHDHEHAATALPEWLTSNSRLDAGLPEPHFSPTAAGPSIGTSMPAREDRAAMRRRAKLRQDENAIGHTFQATRRAIDTKLDLAGVSGRSDEVQRLNDRLREARRTAELARQAVAAGNRAEVQRLIARLRSLD